MMPAPIRIGQIGICHEHAAATMTSLRRLPELFEVVGVVDDRASTAARRGSEDLSAYEGLPWLSEAELCATPGLQAVLVETANADLVPTALRCLARGLAMHMDKPGSEDHASFAALREGCHAAGLPFQMGYMFRGNPALGWIRQALRDGILGEVFEIQAGMSHDYGGEAYQHYLGAFAGGIMFNLGCHLIDLVVTLLGEPQAVTPFLKSAPGDEPHIHNHCLSILEYPQALVCLHACSRELGGLDKRRLKICGTGGTIELDPLERHDGQPIRLHLDLKQARADYAAGEHVVDFGRHDDRYEQQLRDFAALIHGQVDRLYDAAHDCAVHRVVLAAAGYQVWRTP